MEGKRISELTPDTSPTTDDCIVTVDGTTGQNKRVDLGYLPISDPQNDALDLKANASDTVNLTGDQTVAGVKTFSSSPVVPTATTNTQAVNKAQMDAADALKLNISDNRVELRGVGFPQGVVSAPVGSTYIDTNATNGAIEWKKATGSSTTGWVVSVGDTGWRDVLPLVNTGFLSTMADYNNFLQIRIKNGIVELRGRLLTTRATVNEEQIFMSLTSLPSAYRASATSVQVFTESANSTDLGAPTFGFVRDSINSSGQIGVYTFMSGKSYSVNIKWTNNGSWPVTLP